MSDKTIAAAYRQLQEAVSELHKVWFKGADLDQGAINQACLKLFKRDNEISARLRAVGEGA